MKFLQRIDSTRALARVGGDRLHNGLRPGHRSDAGNVVLQSGAAYRLLVEMRSAAQGSIDDQGDLASLYQAEGRAADALPLIERMIAELEGLE